MESGILPRSLFNVSFQVNPRGSKFYDFHLQALAIVHRIVEVCAQFFDVVLEGRGPIITGSETEQDE